MSEAGEGASVAREAGHRAARNTALLMSAEVVGRLAWFAVFAGLGRTQGEEAVGVFVFAAALVQIAMLGVDLGLDRYLIRTVAKHRDRRHDLTSDIVMLKLALVVPVALTLVVLANLLDFSGQTKAVIYVLAIAFSVESLGRTVFALLTAYEKGAALAITAVLQRIFAAALGIVALLLGFGVVTVATAYLFGVGFGLVLGAALTIRAIGPLRWSPNRRRWLGHARASLPFATEDVFMVILFKVDALILALMTTEAAVGLYGAAYRFFEATLVVPYALVRAFSAMYVYLERESEPSIQGTFSRSIKLLLAALVPVSVAFALLAEPLLTSTFGEDFTGAAGPLRLLAPAVTMLGVVSLSCAVITARRDPKIVMYLTAIIAVINVALNLILIPPFEASGAAAGMLISEAAFSALALAIAARTVGGLAWTRMLGGPLLAGAVMAAVVLPLDGAPVIALGGGLLAYTGALFAFERVLSPGDVRFALDLVRRYLPGASPA